MNSRTILRLVGILTVLTGVCMGGALFWSWYYGESMRALLVSMGICLGAGGIMSLGGWGSRAPVMRREGMAVVGLGWLLAALFGALPFYFSGISFVDAYFETMSGFTTTGSTILPDIERLPRGILFWRSFTHWLGGMGIVVLFVAILPNLRASGKQLFKSEVPGPTAEAIRPRVSETASLLWRLYLGFSLAQTLVLWALGLPLFEALCHTFGTMATGGFSTWNASIGHYDSAAVEAVIVLFMIFAGTSFGLYFQVLNRKPRALFRDAEWRFFMGLIALAACVITVDLAWNGTVAGVFRAFRYAAFQVVSMITTTGYGTADFGHWSPFSQLVLVALMFVGGCAGSTGGGMKVIRILVVLKFLYIGLEQVFRPRMVRVLKVNGVPVENDVRDAILVFFCLSLIILVVCSLAMAALGLDVVTAVTSVIATLHNIGPGLGAVGPAENFAELPAAGKYLLSLCMVLGRLELFAILVLLMPSFWRGH